MIERTSIHRAKRGPHVLLIVLLIISLVLPVGTVAAATSSATIIEIKGDVQIIRGGSEKSFAAFKDMRLTEGDKIITGPNSSAKVELENDNAVLTLSDNTRIYLSELKVQGDDQQTSINLQAGGIGSKVKKALSSVSRFNIKTPTATMGVRGTQFYTQYRDGEVDIRVLSGLVDVTIGGGNDPVDEGAGGAAFTYTLGAMQQMGFNDGASPDQLGGLEPGAFSLGGLDETFINDLEGQAASDPDSVPPGLLDGAPAARDQAREKSKERQGREGQAPREQDEKPGERGREIARSTPNTGNGQAPNIIDQTPQTIPPGGTPGSTVTPPAPPPAPTYDDDDGGDDYYEPTPPPASCPTGSHKVTFSVVGGNGSIYAALIENAQAAVSGNCYPAGTKFVFTAEPENHAHWLVKEWIINGERFEMDIGVPYPGQMLEGLELWQDLNITLEFMEHTGPPTSDWAVVYPASGSLEVTINNRIFGDYEDPSTTIIINESEELSHVRLYYNSIDLGILEEEDFYFFDEN